MRGAKRSLSEIQDPSQRFRQWHASETCGGSWSDTQLRFNPITIPSNGTGDDHDGVFV